MSAGAPGPLGPSRATLSDRTYDVVRERILRGWLSPGQPVRQEAIAADLGISKIPLREALGRLVHDGLLSAIPNKGFAVSPLTGREAAEIFSLRRMIEPAASAAASHRASEAHRAEVDAAYRALIASGRPGDDPIRANHLFHLTLIDPMQRLTRQMVERLQILCERYVRRHLTPAGRERRAELEHGAIYSAWMARQADLVARLIEQHIDQTRADLEGDLSSGVI